MLYIVKTSVANSINLSEMPLICSMDFIDQKIQLYAEQHTAEEPDNLKELNRYTHSSVMRARMLSGHLQGRFLSMVSRMMKPTYVLDIGTYTGYSALCLAEGLAEGGRVYTIDNNEEVTSVAGRFIGASPYADNISMVLGDAIDELSKLNAKVPHWDLIWIDAEKSQYADYYRLCIDKLRPGGLIMADNVLWSGKVTDDKARLSDEDTQALDTFNKMVSGDKRLMNLLLPIRDGIMMMLKK